jgi:hypothetical protein
VSWIYFNTSLTDDRSRLKCKTILQALGTAEASTLHFEAVKNLESIRVCPDQTNVTEQKIQESFELDTCRSLE